MAWQGAPLGLENKTAMRRGSHGRVLPESVLVCLALVGNRLRRNGLTENKNGHRIEYVRGRCAQKMCSVSGAEKFSTADSGVLFVWHGAEAQRDQTDRIWLASGQLT